MTLRVTCPLCQTTTVYASTNPWRPFCSERCKLIDLGEWAHDRYAIPMDDPDDAAPDMAPPSSP